MRELTAETAGVTCSCGCSPDDAMKAELRDQMNRTDHRRCDLVHTRPHQGDCQLCGTVDRSKKDLNPKAMCDGNCGGKGQGESCRSTKRGIKGILKALGLSKEKVISKEAIMDFEMPALVNRLMKELELSYGEAHMLFTDMKKFLYICATTKGNRFSPSHMVDEAWHTFIIFTEDYAAFCEKYFGYFLHHRPFTEENLASERAQSQDIIPSLTATFGEPSKFWMSAPGDCDNCAPSKDCNGKGK